MDGECDGLRRDRQGRDDLCDRLMMLVCEDIVTRHPARYRLLISVLGACHADQPHGRRPVMWKVSIPLIRPRCWKPGLLGGEMSGPISSSGALVGFCDGSVTVLRMLELMSILTQNSERVVTFRQVPGWSWVTPEITSQSRGAQVEIIGSAAQAGGLGHWQVDMAAFRVDYSRRGLVRASTTTRCWCCDSRPTSLRSLSAFSTIRRTTGKVGQRFRN